MIVKPPVYRVLYRALWDKVIEKEFKDQMPSGMRNRYARTLWVRTKNSIKIGENFKEGDKKDAFIVFRHYHEMKTRKLLERDFEPIFIYKMLIYLEMNTPDITEMKPTAKNAELLLEIFKEKFKDEIANEIIFLKEKKKKKPDSEIEELKEIFLDKSVISINDALGEVINELDKFYKKSKIIDPQIDLLEKKYFENWKRIVEYRKNKSQNLTIDNALAPLSKTVWFLYRMEHNSELLVEMLNFNDILNQDEDNYFFDVKFKPNPSNSNSYNAICIYNRKERTLDIEIPTFERLTYKKYINPKVSFKLDDHMIIPSIAVGIFTCSYGRSRGITSSVTILERITLDGWNPKRPDTFQEKFAGFRIYVEKFLRWPMNRELDIPYYKAIKTPEDLKKCVTLNEEKERDGNKQLGR